ncbi:MAG: hypothetical protein ABSH09_19820 [Bryobacteraceae bacterium]
MLFDLYTFYIPSYHVHMKLFAFALLFCSALGATNLAQLKQVQTVYILPMSSGMDQYLANKLARGGLFQIVTDPKKADAIFTDQIGEGFERKLDELYPTAPLPKEADADDDSSKDDSKSDAKSSTKEDMSGGGMMNRASSWGRGKGTFFIVDRKSRAVIWSTYDRAPNRAADTMDHKADQIVERLKRDLKETK